MDSYTHFASSRKQDASYPYCMIQAVEGITKTAKTWVTKHPETYGCAYFQLCVYFYFIELIGSLF